MSITAVFPTETWIQIVSYACAESGLSGRALSLTCWALHDITEPEKLYSVALVNPKQILKFALFLEENPNRRSVTHLFLASPNPYLTTTSLDEVLIRSLNALELVDSPEQPVPSVFGSPSHIGPTSSISPSSNTQLKVDMLSIEKAVWHVVKLVAPSLRTLHAHFTFLHLPLFFDPVRLLHLQELTFYGIFTLSRDTRENLPALRRLEVGNFPPQRGIPVIQYISKKAPLLTHLYFPHRLLTHINDELLGWLNGTIEESWKDGISTSPKVFVEVDSRELLKRINDHGPRDPRVLLVERSISWIDIPRAEKNWRDRAAGSDGRWRIPGA
ncbi:hypothetical protein BDQ12DRAFT_324382 [Crucibulum laeve]|uniref:F-box domain-containing protein n=1 Tax=Crucibulum laeve TaxID=68775 RepID=A0A5C3LSS5_9AGAR|nr:hypothetical protein BDQ12DRAFT_324382 [Crucibulum laeve]